MTQEKLIEVMVAEGVFQIKDGEVYFSDRFANIIEETRVVLAENPPDWLTDPVHKERDFTKAVKKGLAAVYLWAYLCFVYCKKPAEAKDFELLYRKQDKEIADRLEMILRFHEVAKE